MQDITAAPKTSGTLHFGGQSKRRPFIDPNNDLCEERFKPINVFPQSSSNTHKIPTLKFGKISGREPQKIKAEMKPDYDDAGTSKDKVLPKLSKSQAFAPFSRRIGEGFGGFYRSQADIGPCPVMDDQFKAQKAGIMSKFSSNASIPKL